MASSAGKTGRLVVIDDSNRSCGLGAEVIATAAEEMPLAAAPKRVSRPDGAVLPFALELDRAVRPGTADRGRPRGDEVTAPVDGSAAARGDPLAYRPDRASQSGDARTERISDCRLHGAAR